MVEEEENAGVKVLFCYQMSCFKLGLCVLGEMPRLKCLFPVSLKKTPNFGILLLKPIGLLIEAR